jgi:hypothetical protein
METNALILEGIATRTCITATYNRMVILLAPHILYTKHDELYLDAVTVKREGALPREVKVGAFKVIGLKDLALSEQAFVPHRQWSPDEEKYAGVTVFAVAKDD